MAGQVAATCEVWIDGARFADTAADLEAGDPTLMDGLEIVWGRDTTVDQPDVSTCRFTLAHRPADASTLRVVGVGATVDVYSTGTLTGTPTGAETYPHGTYSDVANTDDLIGAGWASAPTSTRAALVGHAVKIRHSPTSSGTAAIVFLPPEQFIDYSGDPTGWDRVRRASTGQTWRVAVDVTAGGTTGSPVTVWIGLGFVPGGSSADVGGVGLTIGPFTLTGSTRRLSGSVVVVAAQAGKYPIVAVSATPVAPELTWQAAPGAWAAAVGTWDPSAVTIDNLSVLAPPDTYRRVLAWSGRISDVTATPDPVDDDRPAGLTLACTAVDFTADLANRYIGDTPWPAEPMGARFDRILDLADPAIAARIDASSRPFVVSWRDVDNASALGLLADLATTVDAVLWSAEHLETGPYLWVEDPRNRVAVQSIGTDASGLWVILADPRGAITVLSSCDVLGDAVQFTTDAGDVLTRIDATWQDQTLDEDGKPAPTDRTITIVDAPAEAAFGVHRAGWSTDLVAAADAQAFAESILARSRSVDYRIRGLTWDTRLPLEADDTVTQTALDLIDGTRRIGLGLVVVDLPAWAPATQVGVYVEGGQWTYLAGRWTFAMTVTPAAAQATPIAWAQAPAGWTWTTTDPEIDWRALAAVGPPGTTTERRN